jgi:hypothetical protein
MPLNAMPSTQAGAGADCWWWAGALASPVPFAHLESSCVVAKLKLKCTQSAKTLFVERWGKARKLPTCVCLLEAFLLRPPPELYSRSAFLLRISHFCGDNDRPPAAIWGLLLEPDEPMSGRHTTPSTGSPTTTYALPTYSFPTAATSAPFATTPGRRRARFFAHARSLRQNCCSARQLGAKRARNRAPPITHDTPHISTGSTGSWGEAPSTRGAAQLDTILKQLRGELQTIKEDSWQFEAPRHQSS